MKTVNVFSRFIAIEFADLILYVVCTQLVVDFQFFFVFFFVPMQSSILRHFLIVIVDCVVYSTIKTDKSHCALHIDLYIYYITHCIRCSIIIREIRGRIEAYSTTAHLNLSSALVLLNILRTFSNIQYLRFSYICLRIVWWRYMMLYMCAWIRFAQYISFFFCPAFSLKFIE